MKIKKLFFGAILVSGLVFSGCGNGEDEETTTTITSSRSISLESTTTEIIGYELEIHCTDEFPRINDITIKTNELSLNGRVVSILGPNIDVEKQNIKIAVMSSGTESGVKSITNALEFTGCTNTSIINIIAVDSSANEITDIVSKIN